MGLKWVTQLAVVAVMLLPTAGVASDRDRASGRHDDYSATICNESGSKIYVAYAWRVNDTDEYRTLFGWRNIETGDCSTLFEGNFGQYSNSYLYYYAEDDDGYYWSGNAETELCVPEYRFERVLYDDYTCDDDEELVEFGVKEITSERPHYTLTLE
ncbi:DUF1036 domain-containing protein [Shimia sp. R11_0]|uniref:DUF1036 domain-containing protein n=1 Tax=Shimia sp. R11_0 TaxID=2821096 RepID=UPI001ADB8378|nr:DUF1036 domain-containing protein [Shimia sp. R11_0]MBO9478070.1 DUF1036 domain-containing protein [Shimia sp. R11_0]